MKAAGALYATFLALETADPRRFAKFAAYACRKKRNDLSYEAAHVVTEHELSELLGKVPDFRIVVEEWLRERHPDLAG